MMMVPPPQVPPPYYRPQPRPQPKISAKESIDRINALENYQRLRPEAGAAADAARPERVKTEFAEGSKLVLPLITLVIAVIALVLGVLQFTDEAPVSKRPLSVADPDKVDRVLNTDTLVDVFLAANGGRENLLALQSLKLNGTLVQAGKSYELLVLKKVPSYQYIRLISDGVKVTYGVNPSDVWQTMENTAGMLLGVVSLRGEERELLRRSSAFFNAFTHFCLQGQGRVLSIGPAMFRDQKVIEVVYQPLDAQIPNTVLLDAESFLLISSIQENQSGQEQQNIYGDYRLVGEVPMPFLSETYRDGVLQNRVVLDAIESNSGVVNVVFDKPVLARPRVR
jgi:hypothetical protein